MKLLELRNTLIKQKKIIEFPKLETFIFKSNKSNFVEFFSLKTIEKVSCNIYNIPNLKDLNLSNIKDINLELTINIYKNQIDEFKSIFEKIISLKNLKKLKLILNDTFKTNFFKDIDGENNSVTNLFIVFSEAVLEDVLIRLQKIFINTIELNIKFK